MPDALPENTTLRIYFSVVVDYYADMSWTELQELATPDDMAMLNDLDQDTAGKLGAVTGLLLDDVGVDDALSDRLVTLGVEIDTTQPSVYQIVPYT